MREVLVEGLSNLVGAIGGVCVTNNSHSAEFIVAQTEQQTAETAQPETTQPETAQPETAGPDLSEITSGFKKLPGCYQCS
eukprot:770790-Prymnesium_polylepis.1